LDRTEESAAAIRALENGQSVELFGQPGIGKTVLLRHVAYMIDSKLFRDGIIYREIRGDPPEDVVQGLWGDFFECDLPFKPTDSQLRSDLQSKQALIILDGAELSRAEVEQIMNVAAACTFLLGSPERHFWGSEAYAVHLAGLPAKDASTLVERELGRPLAGDEASAVEAITNALKGNPLRLLQEVATARLDDRSLTSIAQDLPSDAPPEKLVASTTASLSNVQRRILSALAIFSGAAVPATTLSELLQVDDAEAILEELEERHLVRAHGYFKETQRIGPTAGSTKGEEAESRNYFRAANLTPSSPKPIHPSFVSYAREDAEFVLRLTKELRAGGADVWIDQLDISPGQRWDRAVEDALAKCLQLVVVLSPAAVESTNVMDEVSLALEDGKTVVPVLHRQCKIPFRLRRLQYVDLSLNYSAGLDRLLETLGVGLRPPPNVGITLPGTADTPRVKVVKGWLVDHVVEEGQPATSSRKMSEDDMDVRTQRRYTLAGEVALFLPEKTRAIEERKRAVAYFAGWIERHQRDVSTILETLPILMCCLRWGVKFAMAAEVIRITKSLEFTLVLNGRWESWTNALRWAAQSAIAARDNAALGWVHHQDGTKALCKGNLREARESLDQALRIRQALRDKAGASVTRHNLNLVVPPTTAAWKVWTLPTGIAAIVCAIVAAIALASKFHFWSSAVTPAPTVTSMAQTTPQLASTGPTVASAAGTTPQSAAPAPTVTSMAQTTPQLASTGPTVASMTASTPQLVAPAPTVASIAAAAPASAIPATTALPTGITTPLAVTPVDPSTIPIIPLEPPPLVRIVKFTGTPKAIVPGESARLSYRLENAERAYIEPSIGEIGASGGDLSVSPSEHTTYTLMAFGRDGATQEQDVVINVRPRQHTEPTREAKKTRDKSSPTPGPRVRESSPGTRVDTAAPASRGSLQIGVGGAGIRIPIGGGTRAAPTATPKPRRSPVHIGIGRGYYPPN
jgi:nucleoside-triphosphatase THEP1